MVWIGGEDLGDEDEWTSKWQPVDDDATRMAVPRGWLYRTVVRNMGVAMVFVPVTTKPRPTARRPRPRRDSARR
jgi:hypothetical protein